MANNIALKVMANIAAKHGYAPAQPAPHKKEETPALRLSEEEQDLLRRAIGGEGYAAKGHAPQKGTPQANTPQAVISLEELARKKR